MLNKCAFLLPNNTNVKLSVMSNCPINNMMNLTWLLRWCLTHHFAWHELFSNKSSFTPRSWPHVTRDTRKDSHVRPSDIEEHMWSTMWWDKVRLGFLSRTRNKCVSWIFCPATSENRDVDRKCLFIRSHHFDNLTY